MDRGLFFDGLVSPSFALLLAHFLICLQCDLNFPFVLSLIFLLFILSSPNLPHLHSLPDLGLLLRLRRHQREVREPVDPLPVLSAARLYEGASLQ